MALTPRERSMTRSVGTRAPYAGSSSSATQAGGASVERKERSASSPASPATWHSAPLHSSGQCSVYVSHSSLFSRR